MKITESNNTKSIVKLRAELYNQLTSPIDAMWEKLYIPSAKQYLIINDDDINIGYCCIDESSNLLQIYIIDNYKKNMSDVIESLIKTRKIAKASLSSNEPISFNVCLAKSRSVKTNTYCFKYHNDTEQYVKEVNLELVSQNNIEEIKSFLYNQIGFGDTFGYTEDLVSRKELYMIKESDVIIATSECRLSDSQTNYADLGVIVNKDYQKRGLATRILRQQALRVISLNRHPVCSTTADNIASKIAIERAGFYCSNIIFDIEFN